MLKKNLFKIILSSAVTLIPMVVGLVLWDKLPEQMATHFAYNGEVTGYSSKFFTVVGLSMILLVSNLICIIATTADPKRKNISDLVLNVIFAIVPLCALFSGLLIYKDALGLSINIESLWPIFLGVVFIGIGLILPKCKQNYTVGIKVPWALHSEENWDKTHAFAGKLWTIGGVIITVAGFLKLQYIVIIGIIVLALVPMVYSYVYYRKHEYIKK